MQLVSDSHRNALDYVGQDLSFEEFVSLLRCPCTGCALHSEEGKLVEPESGADYPVVDGITYLWVRDWRTPRMLSELLRCQRFYGRVRNGEYEKWRTDDSREAKKSIVKGYQKYTYSILDRVDFANQPLVLDCSSGFMETSWELRRRGARVIAQDFNPFELQNPRFYSLLDDEEQDWDKFSVLDGFPNTRSSEVPFPRVVSLTERLPFSSNTFDIVFIRSALHHMIWLEDAIKEIARVLKPGGQFVVAGECIRPCWDTIDDHLGDIIDYQEGVAEHVQTWRRFQSAQRRAGLSVTEVIPILAGSGKRVRRWLGKAGVHDPMEFFEMNTMKSFQKTLLHLMGCVVGWRAVKSKYKTKTEVELGGDTTLPWELVEWKSNKSKFELEALAAFSDLPTSIYWNDITRPECFGIGRAIEGPFGKGVQVFSEGELYTGRVATPAEWRLEVTNPTSEAIELFVSCFPTEHEWSLSYPPGRSSHVLRVHSPNRHEALAWRFRTGHGGKLVLHSLCMNK